MSDRKIQVFDEAFTQLRAQFPGQDLVALHGVGQIRFRLGDEAMWFLPWRRKVRQKKQIWEDCTVGRFSELIRQAIERRAAAKL